MRYQDDINTENKIKSIGRAAVAVAQWPLTRNGQTRVRIREAHVFYTSITIFSIVHADVLVLCILAT